ncbi:hypothetical protein H8Z59_12960 [Mycolicibacterium fortuitum]|uniref:hypothetical protein n=1 Tax=Mycolicibacterium fortuitum TaxID=1766 RepID=UPI001CDD2227|nr:hypothetical protein [Mycolicibacterium fortuitum]UBV23951.1 hypothetical protein H8Z59_12960 [Mycolicibacterium fortuitum]
MIIQAFRKNIEVRQFTPETGEIGPATVDPDHGATANGLYHPLGYDIGVLYRSDDQLWLQVGADRFAAGDVSSASTTHLGSGRAILDLVVSGCRYSWEYQLSPRAELDVTSFATFGEHEDDFDFGLFIANVMKDPGRQQRIYSY